MRAGSLVSIRCCDLMTHIGIKSKGQSAAKLPLVAHDVWRQAFLDGQQRKWLTYGCEPLVWAVLVRSRDVGMDPVGIAGSKPSLR